MLNFDVAMATHWKVNATEAHTHTMRKIGRCRRISKWIAIRRQQTKIIIVMVQFYSMYTFLEWTTSNLLRAPRKKNWNKDSLCEKKLFQNVWNKIRTGEMCVSRALHCFSFFLCECKNQSRISYFSFPSPCTKEAVENWKYNFHELVLFLSQFLRMQISHSIAWSVRLSRKCAICRDVIFA